MNAVIGAPARARVTIGSPSPLPPAERSPSEIVLSQDGQDGRTDGKGQTRSYVDTCGQTSHVIAWTIGEFARRIGVSVKTLQRWDRDGVLPARRYPTGRRFYTPAELAMALDADSR